MDEATANLVKLAEELTERVDALEKENGRLREESEKLSKQASVQQEPEHRPVVDEKTASETVDALVKAGALNADQADASRKILMEDAEAPHRILQRILNAQAQSKTASSQDDVSGGRVVNGRAPDGDPGEDCLDRMARILGMY